ncbi:hypothetical protein AB0B25_01995 [Nocardia sp. NPDC049190]|uniref:hypothetical protein n=1 Tax=Nocardia sp. NPDC049190 TaxID=3155650 RepID=UPI0033C65875
MCTSLPIDQADQLAAIVTRRVADSIETSEKSAFDLVTETGISIHRLAALFDGRQVWTITELLLIAVSIDANVRDWFDPVELAEVDKLADQASEVSR